ncbi:ParB/RepB/Spo0J family partition protein [Moraxella osloensis]|nr:ParB/RepB/Spo0J family partition protein [Moraxella osloensis]
MSLGNLSKSLAGLKAGQLLNKPHVDTVNKFDISKIHEDKDNARKEFNDETLDELAESIKQNGVISPISLRPHDTIEGEYIINHGHRRLRASKLAGLTEIPAFLDININSFGRLIENIQREDLNPLDIANQLKIYLDNGETNRSIAQKIGKSETWVSRHLGLQDSPELVKKAINDGKIKSVEAARTLATLTKEHPEEVNKFIEHTQGDISQIKVRELTKKLKGEEDDTSTQVTESELANTPIETAESQRDQSSESIDAEEVGAVSAKITQQDDFVLKAQDKSTDTAVDNKSAASSTSTSSQPVKQPSVEIIELFVGLLDSISLDETQLELLNEKLSEQAYDRRFDSLRQFLQNKQS